MVKKPHCIPIAYDAGKPARRVKRKALYFPSEQARNNRRADSEALSGAEGLAPPLSSDKGGKYTNYSKIPWTLHGLHPFQSMSHLLFLGLEVALLLGGLLADFDRHLLDDP